MSSKLRKLLSNLLVVTFILTMFSGLGIVPNTNVAAASGAAGTIGDKIGVNLGGMGSAK